MATAACKASRPGHGIGRWHCRTLSPWRTVTTPMPGKLRAVVRSGSSDGFVHWLHSVIRELAARDCHSARRSRWLPLVTTPSHPEYPAGHPSQNGAAATVLLSHFGQRQTFTLTTSGQPSRTYSSITDARSDGNNERVWGGMHYPSTVEISDALGEAIAKYVNGHSMKRLHRQQR
jgi:hypothetical protein